MFRQAEEAASENHSLGPSNETQIEVTADDPSTATENKENLTTETDTNENDEGSDKTSNTIPNSSVPTTLDQIDNVNDIKSVVDMIQNEINIDLNDNKANTCENDVDNISDQNSINLGKDDVENVCTDDVTDIEILEKKTIPIDQTEEVDGNEKLDEISEKLDEIKLESDNPEPIESCDIPNKPDDTSHVDQEGNLDVNSADSSTRQEAYGIENESSEQGK